MTKSLPYRLLAIGLASALPAAFVGWQAQAAPTGDGTLIAALPEDQDAAKLPPAPPREYLPISEIRKQWTSKNKDRQPVLTPTFGGEYLKEPMVNLLTAPAPDGTAKSVAQPKLLAQAPGMPRGRVLPPAPIAARPAPRPTVPKWVRYPLEFQLCGIALGTKAVDKDRYNRIDRYGLFALHGNPTAVVVPVPNGASVSLGQQPPEVAALFGQDRGGGLPAWASAITVALDNNHVEWLYRRDTYSMGFVVDRLGYVDAIVVAGVQSPIAKTQLEDPLHYVQLGDDLRKVFFRYGYPDTMETYLVNPANAAAGITTAIGDGGGQGAAPQDAGAAPGAGAPGQDGGAAAGAAAPATGPATAAFRTFEVRYEQSYNVVFTIRNNRVVRIYIFGDPDFFNATRRQRLRSSY